MKIRVAVIFGGRSVEHEISILSAQQVMRALDTSKYDMVPLYIAKSGLMYSDHRLCDLKTFKDLEQLENELDPVQLIRNGNQYEIRFIRRTWKHKAIPVDLAFPVIHGTNGEDGTLQGYLELLGIPYCGCRVLGAAIGQDKTIMKQILDRQNIPTPPWFYVTAYEPLDDEILKQCEELGYPLILKPACLGSSVGIQIVREEKHILSALRQVFQYDEKAVVEKLVEPMREVNCSVLGDLSKAEASEIEEVIKSSDILSYQDKYEGDSKSKGMASAARKMPAELTKEMYEEVKELALKTFHALHASGVCRIDFLIDDAKEQVYVNEINTIPGSLSFYLWEAAGVGFPELLDKIIQLAFDHMRRSEQRIYSYDTNLLANYHEGGLKGIKK